MFIQSKTNKRKLFNCNTRRRVGVQTFRTGWNFCFACLCAPVVFRVRLMQIALHLTPKAFRSQRSWRHRLLVKAKRREQYVSLAQLERSRGNNGGLIEPFVGSLLIHPRPRRLRCDATVAIDVLVTQDRTHPAVSSAPRQAQSILTLTKTGAKLSGGWRLSPHH